MARRRTFNPGEVRKINSDIADVIHSSGNAISNVFDELHKQVRMLNKAEKRVDALKDDGKIVPKSLRGEIKDIKGKIHELDKRTSRYAETNKKRLKERLEVVKTSPGASIHKDAIRAIERDIFQLSKKMKAIGADVRDEVRKISAKMKGLEEKAGGLLGYRTRVSETKSPEQIRRENDAKTIAALTKRWKSVRPRMAKRDQRLMGPGSKVRHSRKGAGRVLEMKDDGRVKVEFQDKDDRSVIFNVPPTSLSSEDMAHIDRQLETISAKFDRGQSVTHDIGRLATMVNDYGQLTKERKSLPSFSDAKRSVREFEKKIDDYVVSGVTKETLDKVKYKLEQLNRKFSGEAKAQWSNVNQREFATLMRRLRKQLINLTPGKRKRKKNPSAEEKEKRRSRMERSEKVKSSRRKKKAASKRRKNPRGYDMIEAFFECEDRTIPRTKVAIDKKIAACRKALLDAREAQEGYTKSRQYDKSEGIEDRVEEVHKFIRELQAAKRKKAKKNPKKKTKKVAKKATRKATPKWKLLINRCQKLWTTYCEKQTKKSLREVLAHLEKMKESTSETVKKERSRCLRAANKEAKRLKMK